MEEDIPMPVLPTLEDPSPPQSYKFKIGNNCATIGKRRREEAEDHKLHPMKRQKYYTITQKSRKLEEQHHPEFQQDLMCWFKTLEHEACYDRARSKSV